MRYRRTSWTIVLILVLTALPVNSGTEDPIFLNVEENSWFHLTEDENFEFFIEAFDSEEEYPSKFYTNSIKSNLFPSYSMEPLYG